MTIKSHCIWADLVQIGLMRRHATYRNYFDNDVLHLLSRNKKLLCNGSMHALKANSFFLWFCRSSRGVTGTTHSSTTPTWTPCPTDTRSPVTTTKLVPGGRRLAGFPCRYWPLRCFLKGPSRETRDSSAILFIIAWANQKGDKAQHSTDIFPRIADLAPHLMKLPDPCTKCGSGKNYVVNYRAVITLIIKKVDRNKLNHVFF